MFGGENVFYRLEKDGEIPFYRLTAPRGSEEEDDDDSERIF